MTKKVGILSLNPCLDKTIYLDEFLPYGLNRSVCSRLDPGGKGINVARILNNFGIKPIILGFIASRGSSFLTDWLNTSDIEYYMQEIQDEIRTNLKIVDQKAGLTTEINMPGLEISPYITGKLKEDLFLLMPKLDILVLSGYLPKGVPNSFYAECIAEAKKQKVKTVLDTDGEALSLGVKEMPYAVKPNLNELKTLFGRTFSDAEDVAKAAVQLVSKGIEKVIISMGEKGAVVADNKNIYKTEVWPINVKSTVGAGDSMVGAFVYGLLQNMGTADIAKLATAAGTIGASKEGTEFCSLSEALDAIDKVKVTSF